MWGRNPPKVQRLTLASEQHPGSAMRHHANVVPKLSRDNFSSLVADPGDFGSPAMSGPFGTKSSLGKPDSSGERLTFIADKTLTGSARGSLLNQQQQPRNDKSTLNDIFQQHNNENDDIFTVPKNNLGDNEETFTALI